MASHQIPRTAQAGLHIALGIEFFSFVLTTVAFAVGGLPIVPRAAGASSIVILASFIASTWVLLFVFPRFGLVSAAALGGMTSCYAVMFIFSGRYLLWSVVALVTGAALIVLAFYGWPRRIDSIPEEAVPADRAD